MLRSYLKKAARVRSCAGRLTIPCDVSAKVWQGCFFWMCDGECIDLRTMFVPWREQCESSQDRQKARGRQMPYDLKLWRERHKQRIDISQRITHLTRSSSDGKMKAVDVLIKILNERKICGSDGFIVGSRRAVCFQDAPLLGLAQNVDFEREVAPKMSRQPSYEGCGLSFPKPYAFEKGARPVIYEVTEKAKHFLPPGEHWRIVQLDLSDESALVDWTHEREWRCPDSFQFELKWCALLVGNSEQYHELMAKIDPSVLKEIAGVSVLAQSTA